MSTTEESLEKIARRMFYIYSSKFEGDGWEVKIDNIKVHKYVRSNNYAVVSTLFTITAISIRTLQIWYVEILKILKIIVTTYSNVLL